MKKTLPPTEALQLLQYFQRAVNRDELAAFVGNDRVAIYGFDDDPASGEYAAYLKLLFPGRSYTYTLNLSRRPNGGLEAADVTNKKVLVCSQSKRNCWWRKRLPVQQKW